MSQDGVSDAQKKLKAAIRVKLEELGVYVDDELPEYIMVMIANKKDKPSMKEDLSLFIGKCTGKFCDWLFDIFEKLHTAASSNSHKKKDEEKEKEEKLRLEKEERKKKEDREKAERDREREERRRVEKEKEREREERRRREDKEREEKKRREDERSRRVEREKASRKRSRSRTWSEDEFEEKIKQKVSKKMAPIVPLPGSDDDEDDEVVKQVSSTVVVKRNIRQVVGDAKGSKGRQAMFMKAITEASVSAGYASKKSSEPEIYQGDDYAHVPAKRKNEGSKLQALKDRLSVVEGRRVVEQDVDEDAVVVGRGSKEGPSITVTLKGADGYLKGRKRIVADALEAVKKSQPTKESKKRRIIETAPEEEKEQDEVPKKKHQAITFDLSPGPAQCTATSSSESALRKKWDGQIDLNDQETSDEEAEIDAVLAATRQSLLRGNNDEVLPPTHQLSGAIALGLYTSPQSYIPTPLSVLQQQQIGADAPGRERQEKLERCKFWPTCNRGETCQFHHPIKNCTNFPMCSFGQRCLYIHPACKFDRSCTKANCPFTHYGKAATAGLGLPLTSNRSAVPVVVPPPKPPTSKPPVPPTKSVFSNLVDKIKAIPKTGTKPAAITASPTTPKVAEDTKENTKKLEEGDPVEAEKEHEEKAPEEKETITPKKVAITLPKPSGSTVPCRFAGGCKNPTCQFKHPKECRFGSNCTNTRCFFYHKPGDRPAKMTTVADTSKYKWGKTA